jgi:hypothetical protein
MLGTEAPKVSRAPLMGFSPKRDEAAGFCGLDGLCNPDQLHHHHDPELNPAPACHTINHRRRSWRGIVLTALCAMERRQPDRHRKSPELSGYLKF